MRLKEGESVAEFEARTGLKVKEHGADVVCRCCGGKAKRHVGYAPYHHGHGLVPNIDGWARVVFPWREWEPGTGPDEFVNVCPTCAPKVFALMDGMKREATGEDAVLDDELLCADA